MSDSSKDFTVINRAEAHKYLLTNSWTDRNLLSEETLAKFTSKYSPDAILWGNISVDNKTVTIDLTARSQEGLELFRSHHAEPLNGNLQAIFDSVQSRADFYFVGLDGVNPPTCVVCPIPLYPPALRARRVQGRVTLGAVVTADGKMFAIRIIKKTDPDLDRIAMETTRTWLFKPALDPDGHPVPVFAPIEVAFRLY